MKAFPRSLLLVTMPICLAIAGCSRNGEPSTTSAQDTPKPKTYTKEFTATSWNTHQVDYIMKSDPRRELDILHGGGQIEEHDSQSATSLHSESFALPVAADQLLASAPQNAKLDILVVVDSSSAMAAQRANLAQKLQPLLSAVGDLDWQIAVVATDPSLGCQPALIKSQDTSYAAEFATAVGAASSNGKIVRGILQAKLTLAGCQGQSSWIRTGSAVAVLFVSNQDNCGQAGSLCDQAIPADVNVTSADSLASAQASYLTDYLASIRTLKTQAKVYSLLWSPTQTQDLCPAGAAQGQAYMQAVTATGGSWGSICSNDFTPALTTISSDMRGMVSGTFNLPHTPLDGSVNVSVAGAPLASSGFAIQGAGVNLASLPASDASVQISYSYATAPGASFKLAAPAAAGSLTLTLDGKALAASDFSYDQTAQTIALTQIVAGKTLTASYSSGAATDGTLFTLQSLPDPTTLAVTIDGNLLTSGQYAYDATKNQITFSVAPASTAAIVIKYAPQSTHASSFPFVLSDAQCLSLQVTDQATGDAIPFTADGSSIAFTDDVINAGTSIVITYDVDAKQTNTIDFSRDIMSFDDLSIMDTTSNAACSRDKVTIAGSKINLAGCGFKGGDKVTIVHKYVASFTKSFILDDAGLKVASQVALKVSVDGVETDNYTFDIKTDTLTMNDLGVTDKVDIVAVFY